MEELIPVIVAILWIAIGLLGKLVEGRRKKQGGKEPSTFERMLQEMARDQSADPLEPAHPPRPTYPAEPPVPSEHRPTLSERKRTPSEHRPTRAERQRTLSEHRPTAAEHLRTAGEHRPTASERQRTASEHRKGDVVIPPPPRIPPPRVSPPPVRAPVLSAPPKVRRRGRSRLASELLDDLRGGRRPLARAVLLREVLGPPVGLRPLDGRPEEH